MREATEKVWSVGHGIWLQDDANRCFILKQHQGKSIGAEGQQLLHITIGAGFHAHSSEGKRCADGAYPMEFKYCPFCGEALQSLVAEQDLWLPPYGTGDGLRIIERGGFSSGQPISCASEFPLPRLPGVLAFLVAQLGTNVPALFALNRTSSTISVFEPIKRRWIDLERNGQFDDALDMPDWSWSIACATAQADGICWPTVLGPVWIEFDWRQQGYMVTMGPGRCIGGAAKLGEKIYVPTSDGAQLTVNIFSLQSRDWSAIPVSDTPATAGEFLSIPVVDGARSRLHWVGRGGRLSLRVEGDKTTSTWRPWETDAHPCHALPEYGPPYYDRIRNRYWQLCFDDHDQAYRYYEIEGEEHTDRHDDIEGDMLTTGDACFSKEHDHWKAPWEPTVDDRANEIRLPLLQFRVNEKDSTVVTARLSGEQLVWELFRSSQEHLVRFSIESKQDLPRKLELPEVLKAKSPWECKAFIFEECLHIYVPDRFKCYRWPLKPASA